MCEEKKLNEIREAKTVWEKTALKSALETEGESKKEFRTWSGQSVERMYSPLDMENRNWNYLEKLGFPGEFPFTRGRSALGSRGKPPAKIDYSGFGTPEATNKWLKWLLEQGGQEYGIAIHLPTQIGLDSDNPLCRGEVGRQGVAIDSLADMETIYEGINVGETAVGTVAECIGPYYLALMLALADKQGVPRSKLRVHIQNEPLKGFVARGTYIFPPKPSVKFACDAVEYAAKHGLNGVFPISYTGYHFREAGATIYQELGFCLAVAVEFVQKMIERGISIEALPWADVNMTTGIDLFEETSKLRAFRRMWAKTMKEKFGAKSAKALSFYYRAGSNSAVYSGQQPLNNIIRGTICALVQMLGGVHFCKVASYDEALGIPTAESAKLSFRTHQILAEETGITNTVDPLAGSYYVEALTDSIEEKAMEVFEQVQKMGGATEAVENGFMRNEIAKSAYEYQRQIETGEKTWVGVNKYQDDSPLNIKIMKVDPNEENLQIEKVKKLRAQRDNGKVNATLVELRKAAEKNQNLVEPLINAVKVYATTGEIFDTLKSVWGEYSEQLY